MSSTTPTESRARVRAETFYLILAAVAIGTATLGRVIRSAEARVIRQIEVASSPATGLDEESIDAARRISARLKRSHVGA